MKALIFDCDGVLVDTERDGHRVAFNRAFAERGLGVEWDGATYGELLKVSGGKERMRAYFDREGWPAGIGDRDELILSLHRLKTELFMGIIAEGTLPLRPGVARIVDEAIARGLRLAVCSTSNERAVTLIVRTMLGEERMSRNGLLAAKAAGMKCLVTSSPYSRDEDFHEAEAVVGELGDPPGRQVTLEWIAGL